MQCEICKQSHLTGMCNFPNNISRCDNCLLTVFDENHTCDGSNALTSYVPDVLAKKLEKVFQLRIKEATLHFLNVSSGLFETFDDLPLLSPATCGVFFFNNGILTYKDGRNSSLSFLVGILTDNNRFINPLRVFKQNNTMTTLKFHETKIELLQIDGKYRIPSQHRYNITMCLGIKPTTPSFTIEVRYQPPIVYDGTNWNFNSDLVSSIQPSVQNNALLNGKCWNCGGNHNVSMCNFPELMHCCPKCLVVSLDGHSHLKPCQPTNRISRFRPNIFAEKPTKLFEVVFSAIDVDLFFLNNDGQFENITDTHLLSVAVDGLLSAKTNGTMHCLTFQATSYARSSMIFAVLDDKNVWRLRFRAVLTPIHGLMVFDQTSMLRCESGRYNLPKTDTNNTIALIGIKQKTNKFDALCTIYAKSNSEETYRGSFGRKVTGNRETSSVSQTIDKNVRTYRRFPEQLMREENVPLSTFQGQRTAPQTTNQ